MFVPRDYQSSAIDAALNWIKYRSGVNGYVVAPGGSGKSIMIAKLAEAVNGVGKRVIILARNEKLLRQNRAKFSSEYDGRIGIYCAGLGEWDASKPITIASIQSIVNCPDAKADVCICDEAHNVHQDPESETQYWNFFRSLGKPQIIGFTATAFRTGSGTLQWGEEIINIPLKPLVENGHIVQPVNKVSGNADFSAVPIRLGEFVESQLEDIFLEPQLLSASIQKLREYSERAKSVLIFTQSIRHGNVLRDTMDRNGMNSVMVSGGTPKDKLATILDDFEAFRFKYLINCNMLTEGYDAPQIDMVAVLRATVSKVLFEQMVYRGSRPFSGKQSFLLLDMGGNLQRHGPLGSPVTEKKKGEAKKEAGRICPVCETFVPGVKIRQCPDCAYQWPEQEARKVNHQGDADRDSKTIYSGDIETYDVTGMACREHISKTGNKTIKVDYYCNTKYGSISEWYSPYHDNEWVRGKAEMFVTRGGHILGSAINLYAMEDLLWHFSQVKPPKRIIVNHAEKFPRVMQYIYEESGSRDSKGASLVDILGDDIIPF